MSNTKSELSKTQAASTSATTQPTASVSTTSTSERSRGFISFLPPLGMSCRGRAEAFARRLQIRLRSLNAQDRSVEPNDAVAPPHELAATASSAAAVASTDGTTLPLKVPAANTNGLPQQHKENEEGTQIVESSYDDGSEDAFYDIEMNGSSSFGSASNGPPYHSHHLHDHQHPIAPPRSHPRNIDNHTNSNAQQRAMFLETGSGSGSTSLSSSEGTFFDLDCPTTTASTLSEGDCIVSSVDQMPSTSTEQLSSSLSFDFYDCDEVDEAHYRPQQHLGHSPPMSSSTSLSSLMSPSTSSDTSSIPSMELTATAAAATTAEASQRQMYNSDSGSESLPVSQSTSMSSTATTFTGHDDNNDDDDTLSSSPALDETAQQNQTLLELCLLSVASVDAEESAPAVEENVPIESLSCSANATVYEPLAADPLLEEVLLHRDDEEICDADDNKLIVVNDNTEDGIENNRDDEIEDRREGDDDREDDDDTDADADADKTNEDSSGSGIDEADILPQRLRRCSSLKSGKTPPGTPGRKKFVRFADALGLDLADVKTFMDEIPTVPRCAYDYLTLSTSDDDAATLRAAALASEPDSLSALASAYKPSYLLDKMLTPMFQQPSGVANFLERVLEQNVCLENALITDPICLTISGTVRVRNLDFHKSVHLRYTLDDWVSYADFQASYVEQSCDGFSDKFIFTIFGNSLRVGQRLEMAVRFSCKGEQFWDNNRGVNYCFQCVAAGPTSLASTATIVADGANASMANVASAKTDDADMLFY